MASSIELLYGFLAAVAFSVFDAAMWYMGNAMFAPIVKLIDQTPMHPMLEFASVSWVIPFCWFILLLGELVVIAAFVIIAFRRQANEYEYGYY